MSDTEVSFGSNVLSCEGLIYDQPALVAIESLGDYNKMNNVVSGILQDLAAAGQGRRRADQLQRGDIFLQTQLDDKATAVQGTDFVFSTLMTCASGATTAAAPSISTVWCSTPRQHRQDRGREAQRRQGRRGAGKIGIAPDKQSASFNILNR